ncbi:beta-lactamase family protein [Dyadobacter sp. CY261]|uniref:serine hydrolase domain-containing protein n=1 Tax=Dyadobacter sp. CY261 TaxID=2907203 RepID=UPI001F33367A|nr:serine hydrolase domain-containing protein [Dyadobacter sp. CY261]MCF0074936.1 beta-lactamase family protein [Dyadobacter sp. CY261]
METKTLFTRILILSGLFIHLGFKASAIADGQSIPTDNPLSNRLDSLVDASVKTYFSNGNAVALSIGVVKKGKTYFYNYGAIDNQKLPDKKTIYELGSMTKTFTGILLAQAVLDKKIKLNDDVRKYLKEPYPNLEFKGIPVRIVDLSNHTSRITRIFPNLYERGAYVDANPYSNYSKEMLYQGLHNMTMDTLPGKIHSYSNMAVGLLGCILEDVYEQGYFTLISKFILKPLKMGDTKIDLSQEKAARIARAHNEKKEVVPFWDLPDLPAIGALRSNTSDLVKYIYANNSEARPAISLSHQLTFGTNQEGVALNWFIHTSSNGYKVLEHGGGTGGSRSSLQCFPQLNSGFVLLTNSLANRNQLEKDLASILTEQTK